MVILLLIGGVAVIVATVGVMVRIDRADRRKVDRYRGRWEAGGAEEPWALSGSWPKCGGG
jgi:hypothetical protein